MHPAQSSLLLGFIQDVKVEPLPWVNLLMLLLQAYAKKIHKSLRDHAQSEPQSRSRSRSHPKFQSQSESQSQSLSLSLSQSQTSSDALQDMGKWTEGLSRLRVCVAIGNARNFVAFTASRLDGSMGPASSHLSDAWYHSFMVTNTHTSCG